MNNNMTTRGVEMNPWNLPEDDLTIWSEQFLNALPDDVQDRINQFNNIPDDDDDDDFNDIDEEDDMDDIDDDDTSTVLMDVDQEKEITSSTPSIATLHAINSIELQRKDFWILQPALNSMYNAMIQVPSCHFSNSTGAYQMPFHKEYDNALMTPLAENTCLVHRRNICSIKTVQTGLFQLMHGMEKYATMEPSEKESLVTNFNYLVNLVTTMEAGIRAQREWNTVVQSLQHCSGHYSSNSSSNLESIDLSQMVKRTTKRCWELTMDEKIPLTTLFDQFQKTVLTEDSSSNLSGQETEAKRMCIMLRKIQAMMIEMNNHLM